MNLLPQRIDDHARDYHTRRTLSELKKEEEEENSRSHFYIRTVVSTSQPHCVFAAEAESVVMTEK
jgi:hypothetical protein